MAFFAVQIVPSADSSPFIGPLGPRTVTSASCPSVAVTTMRCAGSTRFSPDGSAEIVARDCSDGGTVWMSQLATGVQALTARVAVPRLMASHLAGTDIRDSLDFSGEYRSS